jgi:D-3-phosphoglycerate dehydrogenase / 2-oxoglutarate reductase
MPKILITPRSITGTEPFLAPLRAAGYELLMGPAGRQPTREELVELLPGCVGWVAGVEKIPGEVLRAARDLKVISRNGTGVDNIDVEAAESLGIRICRAEGANAQGVAELTIGLIFALLRQIPLCDHRLKKRQWERLKGTEADGKTLGVIGCGRIGARVARMSLALGMSVCAYDPCKNAALDGLAAFRWAELDELFRHADIFTLHCPPQPNGPLVNAARLTGIKPGAYLVNTARADLIDESVVFNALESGRLAGYATDVFPTEPPTDYRLIEHPRVIATPHAGAYTEESINRATSAAVENLLQALPAGARSQSC